MCCCLVAVVAAALLLLQHTHQLIQQRHCMDGNRANANELSLAVAIGLTRTAQVRIVLSTWVDALALQWRRSSTVVLVC